MKKFYEHFPQAKKKRIFLPVIHVSDLQSLKENIKICKEIQVDGVFLINHSLPSQKLLELVSELYPKIEGQILEEPLWIGVNLLELFPHQIFPLLESPQFSHLPIRGVWVDNCGINEIHDSTLNFTHHLPFNELCSLQKYASRMNFIRPEKYLYFGGIDFKYQPTIKNLTPTLLSSLPFIDVVTTSGTGTGISAPLEKVKKFSDILIDPISPTTPSSTHFIHQKPLCLASGISSSNITIFLPYTEIFLVATSISKSFHLLEKSKVSELFEIINSFPLYY